MSSDNGNYIVGIEMDDMEKEDKTTDILILIPIILI